jgi:hypothetical protein
MSNAAIAWAKKQKTGSPTLKAVLVAIADYADEQGCCWPSQKRISDDTELAERTVRKALADLEELNYIVRSTRSDPTRQVYMSDRIKLLPNRTPGPGSQRHVVPGPAAPGAEPAACGAEPAAAGAGASGISRQEPAAPHAAKPSYEPSYEPSEGKGEMFGDAEPTGPGVAGPHPRGNRGTRIPEDWTLGPDELREALKIGLTQGQAEFEAGAFADWWKQQPGAGGLKLDWMATWRTWCRRNVKGSAQTAAKTGVNRFGDRLGAGGARVAI